MSRPLEHDTHTDRLTCCQQGLQSCVIAVAIACFKVEVCRGPSGIGARLLYCLYLSRGGALWHKVHVHHDQHIRSSLAVQSGDLNSRRLAW